MPATPDPPDWIKGEALLEWERITPELHRLRLLSNLDRSALAMYCFTWAHWLEVKDTDERKERYAAAAIAAYHKEFGLTPSSRQRMKVPEGPDDDGPGLLN